MCTAMCRMSNVKDESIIRFLLSRPVVAGAGVMRTGHGRTPISLGSRASAYVVLLEPAKAYTAVGHKAVVTALIAKSYIRVIIQSRHPGSRQRGSRTPK